MTLKKILSPVALVCAAVMMLTACGDSTSVSDKIKEYIPDDCLMVMSGDVQRLLGQINCKSNSDGQIEPSDELSQLASNDKDFEKLLDFKGIDWNNVVVGVRGKGEKMSALVIFSVTDIDTFCKSMKDASEDEDLEIDQDGDYTTVGDKNHVIALKGNLGFMAIKNGTLVKRSKAAATIDEWRDNAKESPLADWKLDYMTQNRIFNMLIDGKKMTDIMMADMMPYGINSLPSMEYLTKGFLGFHADAEGPQITMGGEFMDAEGKIKEMPQCGSFDASLLAYASPKDIMAFGAGFGSTKDMASGYGALPGMNKQMLEQLQAVYDLFDGSSLMGAAGPLKGVESFTDMSYDKWHFVLAAKLKGDNASKAKDMLAMLAATADSAVATGNEMVLNIPIDYSYDDFDYEYAEPDFYGDDYVPQPKVTYGKLYIKQEGNVLVMSNAPIAKQSNSFKAGEFEGKCGEFQIALSKADLQKYTGLVVPFGVSFVVDAPKGGGSVTAVLALTETEGSIYDNLMKVFGAGK